MPPDLNYQLSSPKLKVQEKCYQTKLIKDQLLVDHHFKALVCHRVKTIYCESLIHKKKVVKMSASLNKKSAQNVKRPRQAQMKQNVSNAISFICEKKINYI